MTNPNSHDLSERACNRRRRVRAGLALMLAGLLAAAGTIALAQSAPATPASAASAAPGPRTTAPTSPTARLIDAARPADDARENVAVPQVAVPLRGAVPDPVPVKPGRTAAPKGGVDDAAARCVAERASGARTNCRNL